MRRRVRRARRAARRAPAAQPDRLDPLPRVARRWRSAAWCAGWYVHADYAAPGSRPRRRPRCCGSRTGSAIWRLPAADHGAAAAVPGRAAAVARAGGRRGRSSALALGLLTGRATRFEPGALDDFPRVGEPARRRRARLGDGDRGPAARSTTRCSRWRAIASAAALVWRFRRSQRRRAPAAQVDGGGCARWPSLALVRQRGARPGVRRSNSALLPAARAARASRSRRRWRSCATGSTTSARIVNRTLVYGALTRDARRRPTSGSCC